MTERRTSAGLARRDRPRLRGPVLLAQCAGDGIKPHVAAVLKRVAARLRPASHVAVLLDLDGTLAPLRRRPGEVVVGPAVRRALERLVRAPRTRVYVISGRRLADVRSRVGVDGVGYLGLHGWEARLRQSLPAASRRLVRRARSGLRRALEPFEGVWVEDKGAVLAVHYREAREQDVVRARSVIRRLMKNFAPPLRLLASKKVWEVFPPEVRGKGEAAGLLACAQPPGTLVLYAGDDASDEQAFRALPEAITVRVGGRGRTAAKWRLAGPEEVCQLLERMAEILR